MLRDDSTRGILKRNRHRPCAFCSGNAQHNQNQVLMQGYDANPDSGAPILVHKKGGGVRSPAS